MNTFSRAIQSSSSSTPWWPLWNFAGSVYSQNGEDGILWFLLQTLGIRHQNCMEMAMGIGSTSNTANLVLHHGFQGYGWEGHANRFEKAARFFHERLPEDQQHRMKLMRGWICRSTLPAFWKRYELPFHVDVFSLDIDGVDFWIAKQLLSQSLCRPRIWVVEYQDILGPERSWTVPYDDEFCAWEHDCVGGPNYCGASLRAFDRLFSKHGYVLVGNDPCGYNAFFVEKEEWTSSGMQWLGSSSPSTSFSWTKKHMWNAMFSLEQVQKNMRERFPRTRGLPWIEINEEGEATTTTTKSSSSSQGRNIFS